MKVQRTSYVHNVFDDMYIIFVCFLNIIFLLNQMRINMHAVCSVNENVQIRMQDPPPPKKKPLLLEVSICRI